MTNEPRGCLAFLFGFGGTSRPTGAGSADPSSGEEGNYHSGPGGYEGMGYSIISIVEGRGLDGFRNATTQILPLL